MERRTSGRPAPQPVRSSRNAHYPHSHRLPSLLGPGNRALCPNAPRAPFRPTPVLTSPPLPASQRRPLQTLCPNEPRALFRLRARDDPPPTASQREGPATAPHYASGGCRNGLSRQALRSWRPNGIRFSRSREAAVGWKRGLGGQSGSCAFRLQTLLFASLHSIEHCPRQNAYHNTSACSDPTRRSEDGISYNSAHKSQYPNPICRFHVLVLSLC